MLRWLATFAGLLLATALLLGCNDSSNDEELARLVRVRAQPVVLRFGFHECGGMHDKLEDGARDVCGWPRDGAAWGRFEHLASFERPVEQVVAGPREQSIRRVGSGARRPSGVTGRILTELGGVARAREGGGHANANTGRMVGGGARYIGGSSISSSSQTPPSSRPSA